MNSQHKNNNNNVHFVFNHDNYFGIDIAKHNVIIMTC